MSNKDKEDGINTVNPDSTFPAELNDHAEQVINQVKDVNRTVGLFEIETANEAIINAMNMPDPAYLYNILILEKEIIILFGDAGIGKTIYAFQSAIHIAAKGYKVLYFDLELTKKQFQKRYLNNNGERFVLPETLYRVGYSRLRKAPKNMSYTDFFFDSLRRSIERTKADVLFIDNMTKLAAGDTDSAKAAIPILEGLNELQREKNITIIVMEHNKKVDTSRPIQLNDLQGSKMKANLVDSIFTIGRSAKDKHLRYIKQIKVRDGEERYDTENVMVMEISREQGYLGFVIRGYESEYEHLKKLTDEERKINIDAAKDLTRKGMSQREVAKELGIAASTVNKYLKK